MRLFSLCLLIPSLGLALARRKLPQPRDTYPLSEDDIRILVDAAPAQWEDVNEGHLGKLLIPRACELVLFYKSSLRLSRIEEQVGVSEVRWRVIDDSTLIQEYITDVFTKLGWKDDSVCDYFDLNMLGIQSVIRVA